MKRTIRALQCRHRTLSHRQRPAVFVWSHNCSQLTWSEPTPITVRGLKIWTARSTKDSFERWLEATPIEEETLPGYKAENYYPVTINQTLDSRYRIICKLGRGVGSTVWLAEDVKYLIPFHMTSSILLLTESIQNLPVSSGKSLHSDYRRSRSLISQPRDCCGRVPQQDSSCPGASGQKFCSHSLRLFRSRRASRDSYVSCLCAGMTYTELCDYIPENRLDKRLLQYSVQSLLLEIDYLHKNNIVHTG